MTALTAYLERLPVRQAELKLLLADPIGLPHMKKGDRKRAINGWMKAAHLAMPAQSAKASSPGQMGIGVRRVPSPKKESEAAYGQR